MRHHDIDLAVSFCFGSADFLRQPGVVVGRQHRRDHHRPDAPPPPNEPPPPENPPLPPPQPGDDQPPPIGMIQGMRVPEARRRDRDARNSQTPMISRMTMNSA